MHGILFFRKIHFFTRSREVEDRGSVAACVDLYLLGTYVVSNPIVQPQQTPLRPLGQEVWGVVGGLAT